MIAILEEVPPILQTIILTKTPKEKHFVSFPYILFLLPDCVAD